MASKHGAKHEGRKGNNQVIAVSLRDKLSTRTWQLAGAGMAHRDEVIGRCKVGRNAASWKLVGRSPNRALTGGLGH